jgi:hypothetical protein
MLRALRSLQTRGPTRASQRRESAWLSIGRHRRGVAALCVRRQLRYEHNQPQKRLQAVGSRRFGRYRRLLSNQADA